VVSRPCPGYTTVSGGRADIFSSDAASCGGFENGKSVLPMEPAKEAISNQRDAVAVDDDVAG